MFKTDKKLKEAAQKTAKAMGIPFSAILNEYMRDFVDKKQITFSEKTLKPTPYLKRLLIQGEKDLAEEKNIDYFDSVESLIADLNS